MDRFVKILRNKKRSILIVGIGSEFYGDDAVGIMIAEKLANVSNGRLKVTVCGDSPERVAGMISQEQPDELIFVDAVEFGGLPGDAAFFNSADFASRFPQISTHKISLSLIARMIESNGKTRVWLLGIQPETLKPGSLLSAEVNKTAEIIIRLIQSESSSGEKNSSSDSVNDYAYT
ncbi:MAG TPA: hydrogenase maturation protease [Verrucomicrobiota bacterium]|nr:hydrogenase maturation protease [Verrucomicrobiota bacterium]